MRRTFYDPSLPATHHVLIKSRSRSDTTKELVIPDDPYMAWLLKHSLAEKDWRIESDKDYTLFIFRDPKIAMLFKLTFG